MGHRVGVVAPEFEGQEEEPDVVRVPAIQHFNGTDFSVKLPAPFLLSEYVDDFRPDIIHSHHPFLLGNTALRLAARREVPLVYTFHTFYERYVHYLPGGETEGWKRFAVTLAAGYANLCDHVIAPSRSVAEELVRRGVTTPIDVIPTGVDAAAIARGDGPAFRAAHGVPAGAFAVGFVSRLAPEKNLEFLCGAVLEFLARRDKAWFLLAGTGPSEEELKARIAESPARGRVLFLGNLEGDELHGLYNAMDAFAFASQTETQGLVVTEAMAAGVPVVAVSASGVSDVVRDGRNGRLLAREDREDFVGALEWVADLTPRRRASLRARARETAVTLSDEACARKALALYKAARRERREAEHHETAWDDFVRAAAAERNILANIGKAAGEVLLESGPVDEGPPKDEARAEG
jgi:glycosyltransferase involved in cell wall biosynthesis